MTSSKATKTSIEINYNGMFVTSPFAYEGGEIKALENLNFTCMEYPEFSDFLKKETDTDCSCIYYVIPKKELHNGLRLIKSDEDFKTFVDYGRRSKGKKIALYLEHFDEDLTEYLEEAVKHKVGESENEIESTSDDNNDDDVDVNDGDDAEEEEDDDDYDDDDDEDEDTASVDHLSADEEELIELRRKKRPRIIEPSGSGQNGLFDADVDNELSKEDNMEAEHQRFLNELSISLQRETNGTKNDEVKYPRHNPRTYWKLMKPILGERYESTQQLKECITNYAVANGYQIWFERNDHMRLLARCSKRANDEESKCPYRLWATWMGHERSFQVKSLVDEHKCVKNFKSGSLVNYKWIANKFLNKITHDPDIKLVDLQAAVLKKYKCQVSVRLCHKARAYALSEYEQNGKLHYGKLWEYAEEIKRSNPGSTVKMNVKVNPDGKTYFQGFYVSFEGLKQGWMKGCRRVLGLGECFLKSVYKGVLLSAVGRDANNQIFPVAWGVVHVEDKENWSWFINLLKKDLNLDDGTGVTLISNQHTGLLEAINDVMPQAEHRQCARYIYNEFTEKFPEGQFGRLFWEASKASFPQQFDKVMEEIRVESPDAYQYLMDKDPSTWSRVFFQANVGCDVVENGITECFNSLIFDLRRKPIITLLESIQVIVMDRMSKMRDEAENWDDGDICPTIRKKLDHTKELERFWRVIPCGGSMFEVKHKANVFMVDEIGKTCSCRMWQLSGLPCPHAVAAIFYINKLPETYVPEWFRKNMFLEAYNHHINPTNGIKTWPKLKAGTVNPLPPKPIKTDKMPKLKRRKRKMDAVKAYVSSGAMVAHVSSGVVVNSSGGGTVNREGRKMTCKKCLQVGHNVRSCKNEKRDSPRKEARQAGRKKVVIVVGESSDVGGSGRGRKRGRKKKGLFGSDPMTEDDALGCGDDIPLAVWRPLLLMDKPQNLEKLEELGDAALKEMEVQEASPKKDKGSILVEDEKGIPNEDEGPISHEDQETPNTDQKPMSDENQEPISHQVKDPNPVEVEELISHEDQEPVPIKDEEPIPNGDREHEDQETIPNEGEKKETNPNEDQDPITNEDKKPILNDQESIPNDGQESIQNEDKKPMIDDGQESIQNEDQKPIQGEGQETIPHEDEEKQMRPEAPKRERTSEKIITKKLRKVTVEKDGESSVEKAVVLDNN